jgi:hypothetical protein
MAGRRRKSATYLRRHGVTKYLKYDKGFKDIYGAGIELINPSAQAQRDAREAAIKKNDARPVESRLPRNDVSWEPAKLFPATYADAVIAFADDIPYSDIVLTPGDPVPRTTNEERMNSMAIIRAFQDVNGASHVALEERPLTWLKEQLEAYGDLKFKGTLSSVLLERLGEELTHEEAAEVEKTLKV